MDENTCIPRGCVYYGEQLAAAGIPVKLESYRGDRIRKYMLPFFPERLMLE